MPWDCLSAEVSSMFGEYASRPYDVQLSLEWWAHRRLAPKREAQRRWNERNRKHNAAYARQWRKDNAEHVRKYNRDRRANKPTMQIDTTARNERRLARNREAQRRYYARKLAAKGKTVRATRGRPRKEAV